jgi:hypothetical protein
MGKAERRDCVVSLLVSDDENDVRALIALHGFLNKHQVLGPRGSVGSTPTYPILTGRE